MKALIPAETIERKILLIRGQKVMPSQKVRIVSAQLDLISKSCSTTCPELGYGFCFDTRLSDCVKNVDRVYPEGRKIPSKCNPAYGIHEQTAGILDEIITRNWKELGYGS